MVELKMDKPALKILETVIAEDDEMIEAWYLLAFVLHRMSKFTTCLECTTNVITLMQKLKVENPELKSATEEILKDCNKQQEKISLTKI